MFGVKFATKILTENVEVMSYFHIVVSFCAALLSRGYAETTEMVTFDPNTTNDLSICQCPDVSSLLEVVADLQKVVADLQEEVEDTQERLDVLEDRLKNATCDEVWKSGVTESGVYTIYPFFDRSKSLDVYCDFTIDLPGWITFQRRIDGSENFYLYWNDYVNGFGDFDTEFWIGLETLHQLTVEKEYELRVDMENFEGETRYAKYSTFEVGEGTGYTLQVYGYSGNAGDSMAVHNGMKFTTRDWDQDTSSSNCASLYHGAWWYQHCHNTNPNGLYLAGPHESVADGVEWLYWLGPQYSLKRIEFKIRVK